MLINNVIFWKMHSRESYQKILMPIHSQALEMEDKITSLRGLGELFGSWNRSRLTVLSYVVIESLHVR